ncbi:MAG: sulfatase-like hydrolase/transferase, partial [Actinomycetes bacterium]
MHVTTRRRLHAGRPAIAGAVVTVLAALLVAADVGVAAPADRPASQTPPPSSPPVTRPPAELPELPPNVVVIVTDDQRRDSMQYMPQVQRLLVDRGTRYTQAMVPTSLCCPSRATILTGLYAHSMRVFGNGDVGGARWGGWRRFHRTGMEQRTMGVALRKAGYRTALIGKYLNYFGKYSDPGYVPPGWDVFSTFMADHGRYYKYMLNDGTHHGEAPEDYSTDVFAAKATEFVRTTPVGKPLFLVFAPYGPHSPYKPAPRHDGALDGVLPDYT